MKLFIAAIVITASSTYPSVTPTIAGESLGEQIVNHGGGCRKSSPPGQCCHMQRSTGLVHCH